MAKKHTSPKSLPPEMRKHLDTLISFLLDKEKETYQNEEKPFSEHAKEISHEVQKNAQEFQDKLSLAKKIFRDNLDLHDHTGFSSKKLLPLWDSIIHAAKEKFQKMPDKIQKDKPLQEQLNIPWEFMDRAYDIAKQLLSEKKYDEAESMFLFLSILQPAVYEYWLGLATCNHVMEKFDEAIINYIFALRQQPKNPVPFFQIACCLLEFQENKAAASALQSCIEYAQENKHSYASVLQEAKELEKTIAS